MIKITNNLIQCGSMKPQPIMENGYFKMTRDNQPMVEDKFIPEQIKSFNIEEYELITTADGTQHWNYSNGWDINELEEALALLKLTHEMVEVEIGGETKLVQMKKAQLLD